MTPTDRRSSQPPALAAHGLRREYDDLIALAPLDLEVLPGELVALVGANGAGKTTLLAIAAGLLEPTHGTIHICGAPAGSLAARARASYVPDTPVFYQDLSLNEQTLRACTRPRTSPAARRNCSTGSASRNRGTSCPIN